MKGEGPKENQVVQTILDERHPHENHDSMMETSNTSGVFENPVKPINTCLSDSTKHNK